MISEELPLFRAKIPGFYSSRETGPSVGPGSYDLSFNQSNVNYALAPFGTTSDRFLQNGTQTTPGAGTYDPQKDVYPTGEVSIVPFASRVDRFFYGKADEVPGPGHYIHGKRWGKSGKCYTIGCDRPTLLTDASTRGGPGSYSPNFTAAHRSHPKVSNFSKYSSRHDLPLNDFPGPGHYDVASGESIYTRKPTSMFVTKTPRSLIGGTDKAPGPGTYNLPSGFPSLTEHQRLHPESFSAFGSSAARSKNYDTDSPGPGAFTGEIAPRRPHIPKSIGTAAFVSTSSRLKETSGANLGPGSYQCGKPTKLSRYNVASVPFRSTISRFPKFKPLDAESTYEARHPVVRVPRRTHPARFQGQGSVESSFRKPRVKDGTDCVYNINYDWTKPTCASGSYFGTTPRFMADDKSKTTPGPGHYDVHQKCNMNSSWGTDGRFKHRSGDGFPGPAQYWHDSTLNKRTFNRTFGNWPEV